MSRSAWPLSAAATALLRDPRVKETELLKLSLKELVVRKAWRLESRPAKRRRGQAP